MLALSPELCGRIVYYSYREDLLALCLACKAFQREAEVRLYYHIQFTDTHQALLACNTLVHNDRLPLHVRTFCFRQDDRRAPGDLGHRFWSAVQQALIAMSNLEVLVLCDASHSNGWVLSHPEIKFSLKEAKLRLTWDAPLVKFLERQQALQTLHVYDPLEDIAHHIIPGSLPNLKVFDGTLMVGMQLIPSPLVYLQLMIDSDPAPALAALPGFGALRKSLRSLNLLEVTEDLSLPILRCVSGVLPDLRHLGILHYPMTAVRISVFFSVFPTDTNSRSQNSINISCECICLRALTSTLGIGCTHLRWCQLKRYSPLSFKFSVPVSGQFHSGLGALAYDGCTRVPEPGITE